MLNYYWSLPLDRFISASFHIPCLGAPSHESKTSNQKKRRCQNWGRQFSQNRWWMKNHQSHAPMNHGNIMGVSEILRHTHNLWHCEKYIHTENEVNNPFITGTLFLDKPMQVFLAAWRIPIRDKGAINIYERCIQCICIYIKHSLQMGCLCWSMAYIYIII